MLPIAESMYAKGMPENKMASKKGGGITKKARLELEAKIGRRVVTGENYLPPKTGKITIKIIDHYEDEVLKVYEVR